MAPRWYHEGPVIEVPADALQPTHAHHEPLALEPGIAKPAAVTESPWV